MKAHREPVFAFQVYSPQVRNKLIEDLVLAALIKDNVHEQLLSPHLPDKL